MSKVTDNLGNEMELVNQGAAGATPWPVTDSTAETTLAEIATDTDNLASIKADLDEIALDTDKLDVNLSTLATQATLALAKADLDEIVLDTDALGAIGDPAVSGDVNGTLSAKLRQLNKLLTDVWDSTNHQLKVSSTPSGASAITLGNTSANATWTVLTALDTALTIAAAGYGSALVSYAKTGAITAGTILFEVNDGNGWIALIGRRLAAYVQETFYTLTTGSQAWIFNLPPTANFRVRLNPAIIGAGTATIYVTLMADPGPTVSSTVMLNGASPDAGAGATTAQTLRTVLVTDQSTVPMSAASLPLPANAAQETGGNLAAILTDTNDIEAALDVNLSTRAADATLTGGTAKAIARGGQKGTTSTNADITHTPSGANHELLDVAIYDSAGNQKDPTQIRALTGATDVVDVFDRAGRLLGVATIANLDVALSTRTKPADQQHTILDQWGGVAVGAAVVPADTVAAISACPEVIALLYGWDAVSGVARRLSVVPSTGRQQMDTASIAGTATSVNAGNADAGTIRAVLASDQKPGGNRTASGNIGAVTPTSQSINTQGCGAVFVTITGTWTGTLTFQLFDGVNWNNTGIISDTTAGATQPQTTTVNIHGYIPLNAVDSVRVLGPTTTGTATITMEACAAPAVSPGVTFWGSTAVSAALAPANGMAIPAAAPHQLADNLLYNPANNQFDLQTGNFGITLLALGAHAAAAASSLQTNRNCRGLRLYVNVTVLTATTITPQLFGRMPVSGAADATIWTAGAAIAATGLKVYEFYPGAATAVQGSVIERQQLALPFLWYFNMAQTGVVATYAVEAELIL